MACVFMIERKVCLPYFKKEKKKTFKSLSELVQIYAL